MIEINSVIDLLSSNFKTDSELILTWFNFFGFDSESLFKYYEMILNWFANLTHL